MTKTKKAKATKETTPEEIHDEALLKQIEELEKEKDELEKSLKELGKQFDDLKEKFEALTRKHSIACQLLSNFRQPR